MHYLIAFILFVTTLVPVMCRKDEIFWYLQRRPIILGDDVHLICNITCCQKNNSIAAWSTENGVKKSLSYNILPKDNSKYDILTSGNGCQLVIKDFQLEDANKNYTCTYDFLRYSKNLTLNHHSFEYQPTQDLIQITEKTNDGFYQTSVNISKAYPQPHCCAFFNDDNITSTMQIESDRIGSFYVTRLNIKFSLTAGTFNLTCSVGSKLHTLANKEFFNIDKDANQTGTTVFIVILVVVVLVLLGLLIKRSGSCSKVKEFQLVAVKEITTNQENTCVKPPLNRRSKICNAKCEETKSLLYDIDIKALCGRSVDSLPKRVKQIKIARKRRDTE
ncbi:uncharacterized protein LOC134683091 [Mytilus trossulus]|uniref:uncharacterized protein LOC134683091 n=1 Tax=Mytilus trossulus TaxID=6551 RepID=UPI00300428E2